MAILPQDQRQQSMLLVIILMIAAAALFYNFVHRPGTVEIVDLTDRVEDLETQNQIAETRIGNLRELRDRITLAERQFELVKRLVPSNAEVPAIYEAIATQSQALDLRLINVEPSLPEPADSGAETPSGRHLVLASFSLETYVLAPGRAIATRPEDNE